MNYWLMKSEPDSFSIDDLAKAAKMTEAWNGIRNYQARNMLRDEIKKGDQIFFYHSSRQQPSIVGIAEVAKEGYPDFTASDPAGEYYDPKYDPENPCWYMADIRFTRKLKRIISLQERKQYKSLSDLCLLTRGNRLSIIPVSKKHWDFILKQENKSLTPE